MNPVLFKLFLDTIEKERKNQKRKEHHISIGRNRNTNIHEKIVGTN